MTFFFTFLFFAFRCDLLWCWCVLGGVHVRLSSSFVFFVLKPPLPLLLLKHVF